MKFDRRFYALLGVLIMIATGLIYAWGVFSVSIAEEFPDWSRAELSASFTVFMLCFAPGSILAGKLSSRFTMKQLCPSAALLFLLSFLTSAKAYSPPVLWFGFGACLGLSSGFLYTLTVSAVSAWFPDRQGFISGLLMMSYGLSSIVTGKLFAFLTPARVGGWRQTFLIFAACGAGLAAICGFLLRRPGPDDRLPEKAAGNERPAIEELTTPEMLRRPTYWLYFVWVVLCNFCGFIVCSQAGSIASELIEGISAAALATVVGLISVTNSLFRLIMGELFDRVGRAFVMYSAPVLFLISMFLLFAASANGSFPLLTAAFLTGGAAYGVIAPSNTAFIYRYFGHENYSSNLSMIFTNNFISAFAGAASGFLYDVSGSYRSAFLVMGIFSVLAAAATAAIGLEDRKRASRRPAPSDF